MSKRIPKLTLFKPTGKGRVRLRGQAFYTKADHDTPEAMREYPALVDRWEANGYQPLKPVRTPRELKNPKTVTHVADAYLEHLRDTGAYRKSGEPTSQLGKIEVAMRELKAVVGKVPGDVLQKAQLVRFRDSLQASGRIEVGTVNVKVRLVRQMLYWAEERGY